MKLTLFALSFFPTLAFAQVMNPADPNLNQIVDGVVQAFQAGKVVAAVSGIVLVLTFLFRKYVQPKVPVGNGALPYITLFLSVLIPVCTALFGGMTVANAASAVMFSGPGAMALWDSVFKLIVKKE